MPPTSTATLICLIGCLACLSPAQEWNDDQLVSQSPGFQSDALLTRLEQTGKLVAAQREAFSAVVARIHGDHREYLLKIDRLLGELTDDRWEVREAAERSLVEIGGRARAMIQQRRDEFEVLEQHMRCARILDALAAKGGEEEEREVRLLRGLVGAALYFEPQPRLLRALRSALGHTDPSVVDAAIRALGRLGGDDEVDALEQMATWKGGTHRQAVLAAVGRMRAPKAIALCRRWTTEGSLAPAEVMLLLRALRTNADDAAVRTLVGELAAAKDPLVAAAARLELPAPTRAVPAKFALPDPALVDGELQRILGDSLWIGGAFPLLPAAELSFADCDTVEFPAHTAQPITTTRVFLSQGSLVVGELLGIDAERVRLRSPLFGEVAVPRKDVQGIALDPGLERLVGASSERDRLKLRSGEFVDGKLVAADPSGLQILDGDGKKIVVARDTVAGVLFRRPRTLEVDTTVYMRFDLTSGDRLLGFVCDSTSEHLGIAVPLLGAAALPIGQVQRIEIGVGGGAMWGFTVIADYSENKIVEVDDQGRVAFAIEEVYGAWDAECLDSGNLLITEFSVSRVREVDRKGKDVWVFEDLKNPYDADRLPNGNTLIADTFGGRVIEVDPAGKVVWSTAGELRPFDADRLPNGNTLVADVLKDRVVEVDPGGEIVWQVRGMPHVHDADRLPNGNTLITLRNKGQVIEVDRDGKVVWELTGLSSPSDADRLPNGNTLVAENTRVREFDRRGNEIWKKDMTWAVEVNRY